MPDHSAGTKKAVHSGVMASDTIDEWIFMCKIYDQSFTEAMPKGLTLKCQSVC